MGTAKLIRLHPPTEREDRPPEEIVEDYLDHLCAPLVGIMPFGRRERLRAEARYNILERADLYTLEGMPPQEAAEEAVRKYGDTRDLSEAFLEEWLHSLPQGALARRIGLPMSYAAFFFIQASLWGFVLLQYRLFFPNDQPMVLSLSPAQIRAFYPEPLPLPESNPLWLLVWVYGFLAPLVAGWLTGVKAPIGAARSVATILAWLILLTFVVGTLMLPLTEGLLFAMLQLLWWIPAGTLTAHVASALARRRRLRFQPPTRRKKSL